MTHKTALLFAGQGAQYAGMGRELAESSPSAQPWLEQSRALLGSDLPALCFGGPEEELTKTENAQPAIFLVSWLALQLLRERAPGFSFQAAAGLSLGEMTALTAAGVFEFQDGLRIARQRGRFMQEACDATRGGMAAVLGLDLEATRAVCAEADVEVANLNCPGQIVISGELEKIARACQLAKSRGAKRAVALPVAGAYHSRLMAGARPKVAAMLAAVSIKSPAVAVISNVTARPHTTPGGIAARLAEQVTSEVRWEESMRYLLGQGCTRFIELGPGTTLCGFLKRIDAQVRSFNVADAASLEAAARELAG
jgi:[acyl-carrier-protein] S-malonyltransferase